MNRRVRESGRSLTLLEVAAVLFLVSATALVAVPLWESDRLRAHEVSAVQLLRQINAAQQARTARNASGGFGFLHELAASIDESGSNPGRSHFGFPTSIDGIVQRGGYCFVSYLCDATGRVASHPRAFVDFKRDPSFWVAYAWPRQHGVTGRDIYAVSPGGSIYSADNPVPPWTGPTRPPPAVLLAELLGKSPLPPHEGLVRLRWREVPEGAAH